MPARGSAFVTAFKSSRVLHNATDSARMSDPNQHSIDKSAKEKRRQTDNSRSRHNSSLPILAKPHEVKNGGVQVSRDKETNNGSGKYAMKINAMPSLPAWSKASRNGPAQNQESNLPLPNQQHRNSITRVLNNNDIMHTMDPPPPASLIKTLQSSPLKKDSSISRLQRPSSMETI